MPMAGIPNAGGSNSTIGATTAGVSGPDVPCDLAVVCAVGGAATMTWNAATSSAGGIPLADGVPSQLLPMAGNLSSRKFWSGSGTVTVNVESYK